MTGGLCILGTPDVDEAENFASVTVKRRSTAAYRERRDRVISFRVTQSITEALQRWAVSLGDPEVDTPEKLARKLILSALPPNLHNGLFKGALTNDVPDHDVIVGDAATTLRLLMNDVIDCIVTSPPYFGQKVYGGGDLEVGNERSPEQYLARLVDVFRECRRVLKPTGTMWVNIDDSQRRKELLGLPWRLMAALQADGWCVRSEIVWNKNSMPDSAKDRPSRTHEFLFLLVKNPKGYFYNGDAVREPFESEWAKDCIRKAQKNGVTGRPSTNPFNKEERHRKGQRGITRAEYGALMNPLGRNRRSVWRINTSKSSLAHYAAYPEELVRICIEAGCPAGGVVCDPFVGSGTSGVIAAQTGRRFLGVDLVPKFAQMARRRIEQTETQNPSTL
jgi:DNA modification methylase